MVMKAWMGICRLDSRRSGESRLAAAAVVSVSQPSAHASEDKDQRNTSLLCSFHHGKHVGGAELHDL